MDSYEMTYFHSFYPRFFYPPDVLTTFSIFFPLSSLARLLGMSNSGLKNAAIDIGGGTIGGVGLVLVGHPFDTLKVRLQTQPTVNPLYSGLVDCVRKTYKAEGYGGFYKGVASPLYGQMFLNAWQFGVWGKMKNLFADNQGQLRTRDYFAAGSLTGALVAFVESPVDLFKTQLQTQVFKEKPTFTTFAGCVKHVVRNHGMAGVFQGLPATICRNMVAVSMYFGSYELSKQYLSVNGEYEKGTLPAWKLLVAGAIGGLCFWPLIYPVDVVKSAIQADNLVKNRTHANTLDGFRNLYKQGGMKRLFPGFSACMLRSVPANAVCFTLFEVSSKAMRGEEVKFF